MLAQAFHFEVKGEGVEPGSIPLRELIGLMALLQGALTETAKARGLKDEALDYSLTAVNKGNSSDYQITASPEALANANYLTRAIANRDLLLALPQAARDKVRELWAWTYEHGYDAVAFSSNGSQITPAIIRADEEPPGERLTYRGTTTVYGVCTRAGGDTHRSATLRLADGKTKTVRLKTKSLAQELGRRLYQTVGLVGEAIWDADSRRIVAFQAESLSPFRDRDPGADRPRSITRSLERLAEAAGGRWDEVDPDEFVRELRRD